MYIQLSHTVLPIPTIPYMCLLPFLTFCLLLLCFFYIPYTSLLNKQTVVNENVWDRWDRQTWTGGKGRRGVTDSGQCAGAFIVVHGTLMNTDTRLPAWACVGDMISWA